LIAVGRLIADIQERYRKMATEALAVSRLVPKLLSEEAYQSKVIKEISHISQENNALLQCLIKGNPRIKREELVDIAEYFEKIYHRFLPEIMEHELIVKVSGRAKGAVMLHKCLLELVLYNLFYRVIDCTMKEGRIKIDFKNNDPIQIIFYDNGCDIEDSTHAQQSKAEDILNLSKNRLRELVNSLGWRIEFCSAKGPLHNATIFSIPRPLETDAPNVVNLFSSKRCAFKETE
jgi:hypothetical protein